MRAGPGSPLWSASLAPLTLQAKPLVSHYLRKIGCPEKEWVPTVFRDAYRQTARHSITNLLDLARNRQTWRNAMKAK